MAGTNDDNTWRLANDELAFITKLVGSEKRAMEVVDLLFDALAKGLIRWDCDRSLMVRGDFQAYPSLRATFAVARGHVLFWLRDEHSRVDMDWSTNCAVWTGPLIGFGLDGRGNTWPIFDSRASTNLTASLVRFHHGDVVNMLTTLGLMPPAPTGTVAVVEGRDTIAVTGTVACPEITGTLTATESASDSVAVSGTMPESPTSTAEDAKIASTVPTILPDDPKAIVSLLGLSGPQQEAMARAMIEIYERDPPVDLDTKKLRIDLEAWHRTETAKAKARGDTPPRQPPEWDARKQFIEALHAWRVKQGLPR
jgi:hypothetical protein